MSAPDGRFYFNKARGQPGVWYGYVEIVLDGKPVTIKIDAKHVGRGAGKHFEGTAKRHLKADQQALPLGESRARQRDRMLVSGDPHCEPARIEEGFDDDELPEEL